MHISLKKYKPPSSCDRQRKKVQYEIDDIVHCTPIIRSWLLGIKKNCFHHPCEKEFIYMIYFLLLDILLW